MFQTDIRLADELGGVKPSIVEHMDRILTAKSPDVSNEETEFADDGLFGSMITLNAESTDIWPIFLTNGSIGVWVH
jgi:hypothetical protein